MQELRVVFALWGVLLGASASAQTVGPPPCPQASNTVATAPAAYQPAYPAPQTAPPQYVTAPGGAVYQLVYPAQYGAATGGAVYQPAYAAPQAAPWQYGATPIAPVYPAPSLVPPPSPAPMMGPTDRNVPSYPPSGAGAPPAFGSATYGSDMQLSTPGTAISPGNGEAQSPEEFFFSDVGFRVGAFAMRDPVANQIYHTMPMLGIDLKRHLGSWPFAISTSLDFFGGTGNAITEGDATGAATLSGYDWRATFLLEPRPGALGSSDGGIYFNPYLGVGLGYQWLNERYEGQALGYSVSGSSNINGAASHFVLGADLIIRRRLTLGVSWITTFATGTTWRGSSTDLGGSAFCFDLNYCF